MRRINSWSGTGGVGRSGWAPCAGEMMRVLNSRSDMASFESGGRGRGRVPGGHPQVSGQPAQHAFAAQAISWFERDLVFGKADFAEGATAHGLRPQFGEQPGEHGSEQIHHFMLL